MSRPADDRVGLGPHTAAADPVAPEPTPAARALFGDQLAQARRYADRLASTGVAHGHIGPREVARLWDRHLGNSAVLADLLPEAAQVVDVGSGAGLPGLPLAIRRPDLHVVLVEPMLRRSAFLTDTIVELALGDRVSVVRGRAEDRVVLREVGGARWVTARAVAPLDRLADWCLPLLAPGGRLLALKGASARDEVARWRPAPGTPEVTTVDVVEVGSEYHLESTSVIVMERGPIRGRQRERTQR